MLGIIALYQAFIRHMDCDLLGTTEYKVQLMHKEMMELQLKSD